MKNQERLIRQYFFDWEGSHSQDDDVIRVMFRLCKFYELNKT